MEFMNHLYERACMDQVAFNDARFEFWLELYEKVDLESETVTFPLWNVSGQMVGYQQYNWKGDKKARNNDKGKYWTYTPKGLLAVWGLEYVDLSSTEDLYLTEGVWDAVSVMMAGKRCIAGLCNNPQPLKSWLRTLPCRVVAVCEGDKAGRMLAKVADTAVYLPEGEDANSMPLDELKELLG